jgi:hypothetical protein
VAYNGLMSEIARTIRSLEELCTMQDRAIDALHTGLDAMNLALQLIQRMIDERGYQQRFAMEERRMYPLNFHHGPYPVPKPLHIEPSSESSDLSSAGQSKADDSPHGGVL